MEEGRELKGLEATANKPVAKTNQKSKKTIGSEPKLRQICINKDNATRSGENPNSMKKWLK